MRHTFRIFTLLMLLVSACAICRGQVEIRIQFFGLQCDSVKIQSFNWNKKSGTNLVLPYSNNVVFKQKESLKPGSYWLTADSLRIAFILISPEKKQKIALRVNGYNVEFIDNAENSAYQKYLAELDRFNMQMAELDQEFQNSKQLPAYMLQTLADSLTARAHRIQQSRRDYEQQVIREHPKTLLASIVKANRELPEIPLNYYGNNHLIQQFILTHYFDDFPWDDPRIFNTPDGESKFEGYTHFVYNIDRPEFDTLVIDALKASSVNPTSHRLFFERLDKDLGYYMSNYKTEHTYIKMLQYILGTDDLEDYRRVFYEKELATINKNLAGNIAPDFRIVTDKGDTTSLHAIQSEYLLLFLHNPNCHTCHAVRTRIASYPNLNNAIANGRLNVLTVYLEDDNSLWNSYLKSEANTHYLHSWNFDQTILNNELYETRTLPYMFLLDKDKRIIKKNILVNEIEDYVNFLMQ